MYEPSQQLSPLEVSLVPESPCLFLGLSGELDLCSVEELPQDDLSSRADLTTVLVDLGDLAFCDLTGLRALMKFRRMHEAQGRSVEIVRANPFLERLMRLCGVTDGLDYAAPADTAV